MVLLGLGALPEASVTAQVPREIPPPAVRDSVRRSSLAQLAEGRRRWRRARITDYLLQAHTAGGLPAPRTIPLPVSVLVTVRRGRVVARGAGKATDREAGPETIAALFAAVEQDMRHGDRIIEALELDSSYGFPRHYIGNSPRLADADLRVDVDSFAVLPSLRGLSLGSSDSALIGRILAAEDRRDSTDVALREGAQHRDARVRELSRRARIRIRDARATGRDSLPAVRVPLAWTDILWKSDYRDLEKAKGDCGALRHGLQQRAWPVRLRAADLITAACALDDSLASTLRAWIDALPADASHRDSRGVSWHAAAHAIVALARMRPLEAAPRVRTLASHGQWQVRVYTARAAAALADTSTLRTLARDPNDNVKEAAIDALAKLTGHADDTLYLSALGANGAQAVRAAAIALKGSPRSDVAAAANATFERFVARANASERDARVALLEAAGRPASDDRPPARSYVLPPRAIALALGADVKLRVRIAKKSGGGSFVVRLRGDVAPIMAARILALANAHYYDGLDWHRVEPDFVIQGGSPGRNEYVGHPRYLRDELGTIPHPRGTVGMSTRGHDTGDAQWFVNLKDNPRLGRDYTVFAEVVDGMAVVDGILEGDVIASIEEIPTP